MADPTPPAAPRPCGLLVDATSETCDLATGHPGDCSYGEPGWRSDNEHDAEAAPPRATMTEQRGMDAERDFRHFVVARYGSVANFEAEPPSIIGTVRAAFFAGRAPLAGHPTTTPEPMTEERLAVIRSRFSGYRVEWAPEVIELLNEVDRLRAPSRESGALLDEYALWCKQVGASLGCSGEEQRKSARAAVDRHLSTLERDAARFLVLAEFEARKVRTVSGGSATIDDVRKVVDDIIAARARALVTDVDTERGIITVSTLTDK